MARRVMAETKMRRAVEERPMPSRGVYFVIDGPVVGLKIGVSERERETGKMVWLRVKDRPIKARRRIQE
jgi:hypothetical protein